MELNVLTSRDMGHPRRETIGQLGDTPQLVAGEATKGHFDAEHLDAGLALAIDAMLEAEGLEEVA